MSFPSFLSLSVDRFCSVAFPLWYRVRITSRVRRNWLYMLCLVHVSFVPVTFSLAAAKVEECLSMTVYTRLSFLCTQLFYLETHFALKYQRKKLVP